MKLRIKNNPPKNTFVKMHCYRKFQNEYDERDKNCMGILREYYEDLFKVFPPWNEINLELVVLKVQYRLLKRDYHRAKVDMPEAVKQNYLASKDFNIGGLTPRMKALIKCQLKKSNNLKKPTKKVTKSKRPIKKIIKLKLVMRAK